MKNLSITIAIEITEMIPFVVLKVQYVLDLSIWTMNLSSFMPTPARTIYRDSLNFIKMNNVALSLSAV